MKFRFLISDCGQTLVVANGTVTYSQGTEFPSNATVTCETDYVLKGSAVVQCLSSGHWSSPPTCLKGKQYFIDLFLIYKLNLLQLIISEICLTEKNICS
jgi:hypothetical protein